MIQYESPIVILVGKPNWLLGNTHQTHFHRR